MWAKIFNTLIDVASAIVRPVALAPLICCLVFHSVIPYDWEPANLALKIWHFWFLYATWILFLYCLKPWGPAEKSQERKGKKKAKNKAQQPSVRKDKSVLRALVLLVAAGLVLFALHRFRLAASQQAFLLVLAALVFQQFALRLENHPGKFIVTSTLNLTSSTFLGLVSFLTLGLDIGIAIVLLSISIAAPSSLFKICRFIATHWQNSDFRKKLALRSFLFCIFLGPLSLSLATLLEAISINYNFALLTLIPFGDFFHKLRLSEETGKLPSEFSKMTGALIVMYVLSLILISIFGV